MKNKRIPRRAPKHAVHYTSLLSPQYSLFTTENETTAENVTRAPKSRDGRWEPAAVLNSATTVSERTAEGWMGPTTRPSCLRNGWQQRRRLL